MSELKLHDQSDHYVELDFTWQTFELVCRAEPSAKCQQDDDRFCSVVEEFPKGTELLDYGQGKISFPISVATKRDDDGDYQVWKVIDS